MEAIVMTTDVALQDYVLEQLNSALLDDLVAPFSQTLVVWQVQDDCLYKTTIQSAQ